MKAEMDRRDFLRLLGVGGIVFMSGMRGPAETKKAEYQLTELSVKGG
jgi:hypothetical protein